MGLKSFKDLKYIKKNILFHNLIRKTTIIRFLRNLHSFFNNLDEKLSFFFPFYSIKDLVTKSLNLSYPFHMIQSRLMSVRIHIIDIKIIISVIRIFRSFPTKLLLS